MSSNFISGSYLCALSSRKASYFTLICGPWPLGCSLYHCHSGMNGARQDLTGPGKGPVLPSYVKCTLSVPSLTLQHLSNLPLLHYVLVCMSSSAACIPIAYVLMSVQWSVVSMSTYFFLYMSMGYTYPGIYTCPGVDKISRRNKPAYD